MYTATVEIEGVVPMKQNKVSDDYGKTEPAIKTSAMIEKEFHAKVYRNEKGCYIPSIQLTSTVIAGLSAPKPLISNRVKLFKKTVKACIFVTNDAQIYNGQKEVKYDKDISFVPTKTGLATQIRPRFKEGWKAEFKVTCVQDWLAPEVLKEGIVRAGLCHGLGSHRPQFGRFIVKSFSVS